MTICFLLLTLAGCGGEGSGSGDSTNSDSSNEDPTKSYPATPLATPSIGLFLTASPLDDKQDYIGRISQNAKDRHLTCINLIIHWNDIEPEDNHFQFEELSVLIKEIKSHDLQCILRVYFNANEFLQAAPDWLFDSGCEYYYPGPFTQPRPYRQPLPWDPIYKAQVDEFLRNLSLYFDESQIYPDAFQISAGGVFGGQWLNYDWENYGDYTDYDDFLALLIEAEKWHVREFDEYFGDTMDLILMVNSLTSNESDPNFSAVLDNAYNLYYPWVQTNVNSQRLQLCGYGQNNIDLIKKYSDSMSIIIEEEAGYDSYSGDDYCPAMDGEDISVRVDRIDNLESENGFRFKGITISPNDLTSPEASIEKLIDHLSQ